MACSKVFAAAQSPYNDGGGINISGGEILIVIVIGAIVIGIIAVLWLLVIYLWKKNKQMK
jgi:hypothetical protein